MAAPLKATFALRIFCNNVCKKPTICLKTNKIQCREMGILGSLKWVGKKDEKVDSEEKAVQEALDVVRKVDPTRKRQCIETVRAYKPPGNVEEQLQGLTAEVFGDVTDWRNQSLNDRVKKYQFLTKAMKQFDHDIHNFDLHSMSRVDDVIKYFQTEVRDTTKLEDISKLDLPKNLHMNLEPIRFDPDSVVDGKSVFPGEKCIIPSVKYRRKYKGYEGKIKWH